MAVMNCSKNEYPKDGTCCDRCAAGEYVRTECDRTKPTECVECGRGYFTSTANHLRKCEKCKNCLPTNHERTVRECTAREDTVCECVDGYYCNDDRCGHCQSVSYCPPGTGAKVRATRTNDTVCAVCEPGTFSNVTDYLSPCWSHTSCEELGRDLKTPGTSTTDAICGNFKTHCPWMLPTFLWSGLAVTALVLFALVCWRTRRSSYRPGRSTAAVTVVDMAPAPIPPLELPLPFTELNGHCQESCPLQDCKLPLFSPDDNPVSSITQDSVDSNHPITPLKASVSFTEPNHISQSGGYGTGHFLRTYSEPQEDEWCGT